MWAKLPKIYSQQFEMTFLGVWVWGGVWGVGMGVGLTKYALMFIVTNMVDNE